MESSAPDERLPNGYNLLHIMNSTQGEGEQVEYSVCYDCLEIVEGTAAASSVHECPAQQQATMGSGPE
ncbi:MAG: hypothetical protein ABI559_05640 [Chloroflexota bacterium]